MATYFISLEVEAAREAVVKAALRKAFGEDAEIARSKSLPATAVLKARGRGHK